MVYAVEDFPVQKDQLVDWDHRADLVHLAIEDKMAKWAPQDREVPLERKDESVNRVAAELRVYLACLETMQPIVRVHRVVQCLLKKLEYVWKIDSNTVCLIQSLSIFSIFKIFQVNS